MKSMLQGSADYLLVVVIAVILLGPQRSIAFPTFQSLIPNGNSVPNPCAPSQIWPGVGHLDPAGGGPRNSFGLAFESAGFVWSEELCNGDADGDGLTNGAELGDPNCTFSPGEAAEFPASSHPGFDENSLGTLCSDIDTTTDFCEGLENSIPPTSVQSTFNITIPDLAVPPGDTYLCQPFVFPGEEEVHAVSFEAILDEKEVVHHFLVFECDDSSPLVGVSEPTSCGDMPPGCTRLLFVWVVGQGRFCFPENSGIPLGGVLNGGTNMVLQIHYNNPNGIQVSDSSGISIQTVFPRLETDVGILLFGTVGGISIPPQEQEYSTLVDIVLPNIFDSVTVIAEQLHMHLLGTGMYVEVLDESGNLLEELSRNDVYDYNNQKLVAISDNQTSLTAGQTLRLVCRYDSSDRVDTTVGGPKTTDEMCLSTIFYIPAIEGAPTNGLSGSVVNGVQYAEGGGNGTVLPPQDLTGLSLVSIMLDGIQIHFQQLSSVLISNNESMKYTAILPTNLALAQTLVSLGAEASAELLLDDAFVDFLGNHLLIGVYDLDEFVDGSVVKTLSGLSLPVAVMGEEIRIAGFQILPETISIGTPLMTISYLHAITGAFFTDTYSEFGIIAPPLPPLPIQSPPLEPSSPNPPPPEEPSCNPQPTVTSVDVNDDGVLDILDVVPVISCILGGAENECPVCGLSGFPSCTLPPPSPPQPMTTVSPPPEGSLFAALPCSMELGDSQFVTLQYGVIAENTLAVTVYGESSQSPDIYIGFGIGASMATGTAVVSRSTPAAAQESCAADDGAIAQVEVFDLNNYGEVFFTFHNNSLISINSGVATPEFETGPTVESPTTFFLQSSFVVNIPGLLSVPSFIWSTGNQASNGCLMYHQTNRGIILGADFDFANCTVE